MVFVNNNIDGFFKGDIAIEYRLDHRQMFEKIVLDYMEFVNANIIRSMYNEIDFFELNNVNKHHPTTHVIIWLKPINFSRHFVTLQIKDIRYRENVGLLDYGLGNLYQPRYKYYRGDYNKTSIYYVGEVVTMNKTKFIYCGSNHMLKYSPSFEKFQELNEINF